MIYATNMPYFALMLSLPDREDMYPVYVLTKYCSISNPVLRAIRILPRNDGKTNDFIEDVIRPTQKYLDRFSQKKKLLGSVISPDEPLIGVLPTQASIKNTTDLTAVIIGVPTGAVVHITPQSTMNIIQSFVRERFQWTNIRTHGKQHKFKSDLQLL